MKAKIFCFLLFFFGVHSALSMQLGLGAPFPYILCGVASICALGIVLPQLLLSRLRNWLPLISYLILATLVTAIAAEPAYFARSARGVLQLYYSVATGVILYYLVLIIPRERMATICLVVLVVLSSASLLEFLGPLRGVSNSFRGIATPGWGYDGDERDLAMHGAIRSKVFSPEPSAVATSFFWLSMLFCWSSRLQARQLLIWLATAVILLWTVRSPTLIVAMACSFCTICVLQIVGNRRMVFTRRTLASIGITAGVCLMIGLAARGIFAERFKSISDGEGSFTMRETGSFQFAGEFLTSHVMIGTGVVGDLEMLSNELTSFGRSLGLGQNKDTDNGQFAAGKDLTNNVAIHFVYFGGVCGVIAACLLIMSLYLANRWLWVVILLQIFAFAMSGGAYNSAPIWCIGFSLAAAARLRVASLERSLARIDRSLASPGGFGAVPTDLNAYPMVATSKHRRFAGLAVRVEGR
jgi:hypothetical protein